MSIFSPSDAPCGIFAPSLCAGGTYQLVSFARPAHLLAGAAPMQTMAGELVVSYVGIGSLLVDLQPKTASFPRYIHGQAITIDYLGIIQGNADVRFGDRCYISGLQHEVTQSLHFGTEHTEIELQVIGR